MAPLNLLIIFFSRQSSALFFQDKNILQDIKG